MKYKIRYLLDIFQFQHGTIKSLHGMEFRQELPIFNSNMVRLKVRLKVYYTGVLIAFQFQHGTIKSFRLRIKTRVGYFFNSNMVRLKGLSLDYVMILYLFSIPTWYD